MENVINYIIDYKGYGNIFDLTNTRTGEHNEITREQAEYYVNTSPGLKYDTLTECWYGNISDTYFSVRAEVALKSLKQVEII